ncbi:MAG TPA: ribonuclease R [Rubricoccaceae bacterium]|nr:ribonuclease R [Rubricoccaceae bacterium]
MADDRTRAVIRQQILSLLRNHGDRAYRAKEISQALDYRDQKRYRLFRDVLQELIDGGEVAEVKGGRLQHKKKERTRLAEGMLSVNPQGHGFVALDGGEEVYVGPSRLKTALDRDRVRVALAAPVRDREPGRLREAEIVEVIERGRTETVGSFERMGHFAWVKPDDPRLTHDVYVPREDFNGAQEGDKVVVSIDQFDDPKASPEGRILRVIGPSGDPGVAVLALAMAQGVRADFPAEVEQEAEAIPVEIPAEELARRLDLRHERIFTIDPIDAKDFDDAIHVKEIGEGLYEVGVHIADVSHYVPAGTALDQEAYARGTSTYLVDRTIPMLPEKLSNGVCSLRPREDKLTYSVIMEVTARGNVKRWRIAETVIHSMERFTYEQAQEVLDGADHPMASDVRLAGRLAAALTKKRLREGAIDFDMPEVKVLLDERGLPVEVVRKPRRTSNRLIEEFMLLANRAVAEEAGKVRGLPLLYRIHAPPDAEKIQTLAEYVRAFGYKLALTNGTVQREDLNALLQHVKGTPEEPVIEQAAIRAMAKAVYSPENIGHYGLGFRFYTHFTSPIRRYPDLIVHRLLKRYLAGREAVPLEGLYETGKHLSARERAATEAERESVKLKQVEYVAQHLGDEFTGVVMGVTAFGVFVEMTDLLTEGLVHVRDMDDDYWEYEPRKYALVGSHTGRVIKLGDPVRVRVVAANPETRKVDLVLVSEGPSHDAGHRTKRQGENPKERREKPKGKKDRSSENRKKGRKGRPS